MIFSDPDSLIDDPRPRRAATRLRMWMPTSILVVGIVILLTRSFWLQAVQGSEFRERAEHNRILQIISEAPRGIIYDRNNVPLLTNISATDVVCDPRSLPTRDEETPTIEHLLTLLPDLSPDDLRSKLETCRTAGQNVVISESLDHDTVLRIQEMAAELPGVTLASSLVRKYDPGPAMAHILGYTSTVGPSDLENNPSLRLTDKIGRQGIEEVYDASLRGTPGVTYQEVNASGKILQQLGATDPVAGQDIQLTVDVELQEFIYSLFSEYDQKTDSDTPASGAAIVIDPRTGEVVAAVSYPSYDPNEFSQPQNRQNINDYFSDSRQPLFNRWADGTFPSGSTIKPFLAAAALQEGIITPDTTVLSTGGISVGPWNFPDWKAGGHGVTNVTKALAESVNTFFYIITGGYESQPGLGVEKATKYLSGFGWGRATGIDVTSEASGFLPSPEWKEEVKDEPWYIGDTYHLGIGQGDILVTPLQIAAGTAAIADGYYLRQPYFVRGEHETYKLPVSYEHLQTVRAGMRAAVTDGSARSLSALPIPIAGKTGTAQIGGTDETHAWFTSFAPYENPELAITVLLERGGDGDKVAVPFAKEIWQWWAENRYTGTESVKAE